MKYVLFFLTMVTGVPAMAAAAMSASRWRGLLCTVLMISPLLSEMAGINFMSMEHYRGADRGFEITMTDLVSCALLIALLVKYQRKIRFWPVGTAPMLIFFILACVSCWTSPKPLYSGFTLFKMVRVFLLFWSLSNAMRTDVDPRVIYNGLVAIGLIFTWFTLKQKYVDHMYRIHGPFDHSNTIPIYLNWIMPLTLMWSLADRGLSSRQSYLGVVAALGMVFAVVSTFSRVGQALAAATLLAVVGVNLARGRSPRVVGLAVLVFLVAVGGGIKALPSILARIANAPKSSEEARHEFNVAAEMMAHDHFFGVGLNNFSHVLTVTERYREHITVMANEEQAGVAHHIYWLTAAETGYIGLGAYLLVMLRFLLHAVRHGMRLRSLPEKLLAGIILGSMSMHATGLYEWAFRITPVTYQFAVVSAITVWLAQWAKTERRGGTSRARSRGKGQ